VSGGLAVKLVGRRARHGHLDTIKLKLKTNLYSAIKSGDLEALVSRTPWTRSVLVVCIYKPPGAVLSAFIDQLCQLLDQLVLLNSRFVVVGDFNAAG